MSRLTRRPYQVTRDGEHYCYSVGVVNAMLARLQAIEDTGAEPSAFDIYALDDKGDRILRVNTEDFIPTRYCIGCSRRVGGDLRHKQDCPMVGNET